MASRIDFARSSCLAAFILTTTSSVAWAGLTQSFQQSGNIDIEIAGAAGGNPPSPTPATGMLTINNPMPGQAVKATLYANSVNNGGAAMDATLNGMTPMMPTVSAFASDSAGALTTLYAYQWDFTTVVGALGSTTYNFSVGQNGQGNQIAGVALVVVYNNPLGPLKQVTIVDGMQSVAENNTPETESFTLTNLAAGPTQLSLFTVHDDNAGTGEQILYNSNQIGTNIDQNLGFNASLLQFSTTSLAGSNTIDLVSSNSGGPFGVDHFGWMLAATSVTFPEPTGVVLASVAVLGIAGYAWRRRHVPTR